MLLISENLYSDYLLANRTLGLDEFFSLKKFTVSDTSLTYRQVNTLDADNLLETKRKTTKGWRKFSHKDIVYALLIHELKKYGLKHEQLKYLWQSFYSTSKNLEISKHESDVALGLCFLGVDVRLAINSNGNIIYYDPFYYLLVDHVKALRGTNIVISLYDIVSKLVKAQGKTPIELNNSVTKLFFEHSDILSVKEKELINIIRNKTYSTIKIKKKDGEAYLIQAETLGNIDNDISSKELLNLINQKNYQDITIVKRDGKIVNCKIEETIKLS